MGPLHDVRPLLPAAPASPTARPRPSRPITGTHRIQAPLLASEASRALYRLAGQVARHDVTVLITGETGTGKELVAQTLHTESPRANGPFLAINCATLSPNLVCATLFGHERGAFTGADQRRAGVFEAAHGGTVFLDEVGELDATAQGALLRALETRRIRPVGGMREVLTDVRIVAATHRDLTDRVRAGHIRSDLYYRLNAISLEVSPLRERKQEIGPLIEHFLAQIISRHALGPREVSRPVLDALEAHDWPGNVRELRNVVERAAILSRGPHITLEDLPDALRRPPTAVTHMCSCGARTPRPPPPHNDAPPQTFREAIQSYEKALIEDALRATQGNRARAAELLGMPRRTLLHKLRAFSARTR